MKPISVVDHRGREQDRPERPLLHFSHKVSQRVILVVSELIEGLGVGCNEI